MINPVFRREIQTFFRTWRTFVVISIYVGVLFLISCLFLWLSLNNSLLYGFNPQNLMQLYSLLSGFQLGLILLIVPAITAGAVSGERERQTLDLLLVTKMSSFSIVVGKFLSSMGLVLLMILASMPAFAIVFYFGGVSLPYLLIVTGFSLLTACFVGSLGILASTVFRRTIVAIIWTYLIIIFLCVGTLVITLIAQSASYMYSETGLTEAQQTVMLCGNPFVAFVSLALEQFAGGSPSYQYGYYGIIGSLGNLQANSGVVKLWQANCINNVVCFVIFTLLSTWRIRKAKRRR